MTTTRPDLVNLPKLTNPTDQQTLFVVQDSGVNQTLSADQTRQFLGDQIGPTGPQGPQGVQGPQGPQGVQGPQGPAFLAYSSSTATPASVGNIVLVVTTSNHSFVNGNRVIALSSSTNFFEGTATISLDRLTFSIAADFNIGNITASQWTVSLTGQRGATGPQGPQGTTGPTGPSFKVTSITTATPASSGNITLVVNTANHAFIVGQRVIAVNAGNNYFEGTLVSLGSSATTFLIAADFNLGTTQANNWTIGLTGQRGSVGSQGPQGVQGPTGPMVYAKGTSASPITPDGVSLSTINIDPAYSNHLFVRGLTVAAINTNSNFFIGTITNNVINSLTFIIQQSKAIGSTPASDWTIVLTGDIGPTGPVGPVSQFAGTATNLAGGTTGSIAIQAANSITTFIAPGSQGNLLEYQVGTAAWRSTSTLLVGYANNAYKVYSEIYTTAELSPNKYIGIVENAGVFSDIGVQSSLAYDTNNQLFTANKIYVSANSGTVTTNSGALRVLGGVGIGENIAIGKQAFIYGSDNALTTNSGALQVSGGVGIGRNLVVGGEIIAQKLTIELTTITTTLVTTDDIIKTTNATQATSVASGALQVAGGAGIGGNLYVGGVIVGALAATINTATNISGGSAGQLLYQITTSTTGFVNTGPLGYILTSNGVSSPLWQNNLNLSSTINAVSSTTGALVVAGGAGIQKDLYVGGIMYGTLSGPVLVAEQLKVTANVNNSTHFITFVDSNNPTASTETFYTTASITINPATGEIRFSSLANAGNTTTGALVVSGGVGVGKDLHVGGLIYGNLAGGSGASNSLAVVQNTTNTDHFITFVDSNNLFPTTETFYTTATLAINPSSGTVKILGTDNFAGTTASGSLQISGGVSIFKDLYVGGNILGSIFTATHIKGGSAGSVVIQTATDRTGFASPGIAGDVFVSTGATSLGPQFQNTLTLAGILSATNTLSGTLQVRGGAGIGGNIYLDGWLQVGYVNTTSYSSGVPGEIRATNEITAYFSSDLSLKENLKLIDSPITLVNQINGYFFDWKDSFISYRGGEDGYFVRKQDVGVIAQEIEKVLPQIVATRSDGYKAVKYDKLVPLLIEAVKELHKEIEILKKRI